MGSTTEILTREAQHCNDGEAGDGVTPEQALAAFEELIAQTRRAHGCTRRDAENLLAEGAITGLRAAFVARDIDGVREALNGIDVLAAYAAGTPREDDGAAPRDPGPVSPMGYLVERAAFAGIDPRSALRHVFDTALTAIVDATACADEEGIYEGANSLAELARFFRLTSEPEHRHAQSAVDAERTRLLSVFHEREASLRAFEARASRLLGDVLRLENAAPFWPGKGATRGAETWQIVHDSMTVMRAFAMELPRIVEGREKDPDNILDIAKSRDELRRLAAAAKNILHGGRADTSRGYALAQVVGMVVVSLEALHDPDDVATLRILNNLAESYGTAFTHEDVMRATYESIAKHRKKKQLSAICADIVWTAYQASRGTPDLERFRFPIGDDADKRGRRALLHDFARVRLRKKPA